MTKRLLHLVIAGLMLLSGFNLAKADEAVRIAPFKGNKSAALSYTYDDGLRNQYLLAAPIMERLKVPGTFFIITGEVAKTEEEAVAKKPGAWGGVTWDEIRSLSAKGFEIGNHSYKHPGLPKVTDDAKLEEEIEKSADEIKKEVGIFPVSFCYPYNARDERVEKVVFKRHAVAREFQHAFSKKDQTADAVNAWVDGLIAKKEWGVTMIHGLVDGFDAFPPEVLEENMKHAKSLEADLWIDTFGNVGRYVQERKNSQVKITDKTEKSVTFSLDTTLNKELFNVPLTVIIDAKGASNAEAVTAAGKTLPTQVVKEEIYLECLPDGNPVTVKW